MKAATRLSLIATLSRRVIAGERIAPVKLPKIVRARTILLDKRPRAVIASLS